jgi:hypothetical protein
MGVFSSIMKMWGSVRTHSLKALALVVCLLVLPAISALGGGQHEASLSDVQKLIAQLDYPAALKLLAKIQREHPDQRDETQRLIMQIISNQGREYNQVLAQLVHVLYDEQDADKALPLINTLGKLDPNRSVEETRRSLGYVKFLKLMDSAANLLGRGHIAEAIDTYLLPITNSGKAGFDLDKSLFDAAGYGDLVTASARVAVARITDSASQARGEVSSLGSAHAALARFVNAPANAQSLDRWDEMVSPFETARRQELSILATAATLEALDKNLGGGSLKGKGSSYMRYLEMLCSGRKGKPPEGIAQAIRMLWAPGSESVADAASAAATSAYSAGAKQLDAGDLAGADPKLQDAYYHGILAVKAASLAGSDLQLSPSWSFFPADSAHVQTLLEKVTQDQATSAEADALRTLITMVRAAQALPADASLPASALQSARTQTQALADKSIAEQKDWLSRAAVLVRQQATGPQLGPQIEAASTMAARFDSFTSQLSQKDLEFSVALARSEASQFDARLADIDTARLNGQDRMNGTVNGKQPTQDAFGERKPGEALQLFTNASAALEQLQADMASWRASLSSDKTYVSGSGSVAAIIAGLAGTESKIKAEDSELSRLTQLAEQQHEDALAKRKEADLAFADGTRGLAAKQYDGAKLQLAEARDLYFDSLLLEEDAAVRKRYTVEIPSLIDQINNTIVEQYVADVDVQVNAGRRLFSQGEFLKSFLILETAQTRWKATLVDKPNSDLDALLDKVRNALKLSGGRDLAPNDSRAPAVDGFLNLANDKVASADKMAKDDPRRKLLLDDAYGNVMSALDVAPVYRTAKALQLRIRKMQAKDDATFRAEAKAEIDSIIDEYHNGQGQPQRQYFALKDYQDILPDYQPLQNSIQELEKTLNFGIRPPSASEISQSSDLFVEARTLYDPANPLTFGPALDDLDRAIKLNYSNDLAKALRRTILLREGSPEASAISPAALAKFAESKRLYNTEDYADAYIILQDLMADKKNASYPPIAGLYLLTKQKLGF